MNLNACHYCGTTSHCSSCKIITRSGESLCDICRPLSVELKYALVDESNYEILNNIITQ